MDTGEHSPAFSALTDRERECLRLVFAGLRAKEIAEQLSVSPATVQNHLASARRKYDTNDSRLAARLMVDDERKAGIVNDWLDETKTIVTAAAVELHQASKDEEAKRGVKRPNQTDGHSVGPDSRRDPEDRSGSIDHGRVHAERYGMPGSGFVGAGASAGALDRRYGGLESGLSAYADPRPSRPLTAAEKALWIVGLAVGIALLAGGALPGLMILTHSLQTLVTGTPLPVR